MADLFGPHVGYTEEQRKKSDVAKQHFAVRWSRYFSSHMACYLTSLNEVHDVSIISMRPLRVEADAAADGAADDAEASLLPYRRPGRPRALLSTSVSRLLLDGTCALTAFEPAQTWLLP